MSITVQSRAWTEDRIPREVCVKALGIETSFEGSKRSESPLRERFDPFYKLTKKKTKNKKQLFPPPFIHNFNVLYLRYKIVHLRW